MPTIEEIIVCAVYLTGCITIGVFIGKSITAFTILKKKHKVASERVALYYGTKWFTADVKYSSKNNEPYVVLYDDLYVPLKSRDKEQLIWL